MSATENTATKARSSEWGMIRQKGTRYYVRFRADGRQFERGAFSSWGAADKMRRRARTLLEAGTAVADVLAACFGDLTGSRLTLRDVVADYLAWAASPDSDGKPHKKASTLESDTFRLRAIQGAPWAGKPLSLVTAGDLARWHNSRRAVVSSSSANRDLSLVSAVFAWAKRPEQGYVESNPARDVAKHSEKGRAREVYLTADESRALVEACSALVAPVVLAALHTGMRRGEILSLRWRSVDLDARSLVVEAESDKTKRGRTVPLTDDLHAALVTLYAARKHKRPALDGSDLVFTLADGSPLKRETLRLAFVAAVDGTAAVLARDATDDPSRKRIEAWAAKRDRVSLHTLRHTAASLMVQAGIPLFDVGEVLGHSAAQTTKRYAHLAPESKRAAVDALGKALSAPAPIVETRAAP